MRMENAPRLEIAKFPRNALCAVTTSWDDNDAANMEISHILRSMDLKGTFYVDPGNPRAKWAMGDGLTEFQLRELDATNEIGSHTWSHKNLRDCRVNVLREELAGSKRYLELTIGKPVLGIAYPWGEHSPEAQRVAQECGYLFARTVEEGCTEFPPSNSFAWGVSIQALARPRILSRKARKYVRYLTSDWPTLALKFFEKARRTNGVWHLFGHASEVLRDPVLKSRFLEICRYVANRDDVWYATNGMLFQLEMMKKNTQITQNCHDSRIDFTIRVAHTKERALLNMPLPLYLIIPRQWNNGLTVGITTSPSGAFEMGRLPGRIWLDISAQEAKLELEHE